MSLRKFPTLTPPHLEAHCCKPMKSCRPQTPCLPNPRTFFSQGSHLAHRGLPKADGAGWITQERMFLYVRTRHVYENKGKHKTWPVDLALSLSPSHHH